MWMDSPVADDLQALKPVLVVISDTGFLRLLGIKKNPAYVANSRKHALAEDGLLCTYTHIRRQNLTGM